MTAQDLVLDLYALQNPAQAAILQRFFKTGPGQYGEGDLFLGIKVPETRKIIRKYRNLPLEEIKKLISSPYHEVRLASLLLLVDAFTRASKQKKSWDIPKECSEITKFYLSNTKYINSRDLVDLTAPQIVGGYYADKDRSKLYQLATSSNLRERRIAIVSTYHFIKKGEYADTFALAELLMHDPHDLIHKATGRMLREVHKRVAQQPVYEFLDQYAAQMPRTMLRYAIERFPEPIRKNYLLLKS